MDSLETKTTHVAAEGAVSGRGFAALRVRDFRLYIAGSAFSRIGDNMETVTRSWLVWELTGSPFWLGIMVFFHWLPSTLLSLWAGVLADRVDNRKLMLSSEILYMVTALVTGILTLLGAVNLLYIAILLLVHGLSGALSGPSRQVFVHDMVGRERLTSAVGLNNSLFPSMQFLGPAVAGMLIASAGVGTAYMVNSMTFVPAIISLLLIRVEKRHRQSVRVSTWRSFGDGVKHVQGNRLLWSLLAVGTAPALFVGASITALMPAIATQVLHIGPDAMGFLLSANGLGAIAAALTISYLGDVGRKRLLIVSTSLGYAILVIAFSASSLYMVSLLILIAVGASNVISHTLVNTSIQLAASGSVRGRVMGLYTLGTQGVRSFNGPLIGVLATAVGAPLAIAVLAGSVAVIVTAISFLIPGGQQLD